MNRMLRRIAPVVATLVVGSASALHAQATAFAITNNAAGAQQLVRFSPFTPGGVQTVGATGVTLTGIDFRPATNSLYGYDGSRLYTVDITTGAATLAFVVGTTTGNVGFDFNPTVDRVRVLDASGANMRITPTNGLLTVDATPYTFAAGDPNFGRTPSFTAIAYTNSDNDPATGTTLYGIDVTLGQLVLITTPNGGAISTVGSLGLGALATITGFDILTVGATNTAFFAATAVGAATSQFYTINLGTGAATLVGGIGTINTVQGLALTSVPEPGTWVLLASGLSGLGVAARRRRAVVA